jgi:hypothetical protein
VELLGQMKARKQREARNRKLRRVALGAGAGILVLASVLEGATIATRPPDFTLKTRIDPAQVVLATVKWPAPPHPSRASGPNEVPEPPAAAEPSAQVVRPGPVKPPPRPPAPAPKNGAEPVEVAVVVRPFGYVQVDDGPRSADALSRHVLKLSPGPHRFTVTCDLACEPDGRTVVREVKRGEDVLLVAPLKPSLVSFQGYPADAVVRIGSEERSAAETATRPFRLETPPGGSTELRHRFDYEVRLGDEVIEHGSRAAEPGKALVIVRGSP